MPSNYPFILTETQSLIAHPATLAPAVSRIEARLIQHSQEEIIFAYCLWGDMARLRIPPPNRPEKRDQLWEHTCFEAFVAMADEGAEGAYREFNFSPSGEWACYDFSDYRIPCPANLPVAAPRIETLLTEGRLELKAFVPVHVLKRTEKGQNIWRIGLTAVVETQDVVNNAHSYWALAHPSARPDFHHPASFTLNITTCSASFSPG